MIELRKCDKCGKFYRNEDGGFLQFDLNYLKTKFFDLCPSCVKEIDQFLGEPKQFEQHEEQEDGR